VPLRLEEIGLWDPEEHYWGEEDDPIEEWAGPIIARGPRPTFELEQVLPGLDPDDPFSDPITESNDLKDAGNRPEAMKILMELCESDLRCLDAHAHLGNLAFDTMPKDAIHHYEVGLRIGELSLDHGFDGVLPWGHIDNRPFLRCMHGFGLCLWRLGRFDEAERIFDRMLWINPSDNQGVRFLLKDIQAGTPWEENRDRWSGMGKHHMALKAMVRIPPWDWPEDADKMLMEILPDGRANESDRLLAAELAGDLTVLNDELADALILIVRSGEETEQLRAKAVISLGPALEYADEDGFDDTDEPSISEEMFNRIQELLRRLYMDAGASKEVRRRILEASVRAPQKWHRDATRAAYVNEDEDWKLTAVFCMGFIRGFDDQILEALGSENPDIQYEAVSAAGNWGIDAAWPQIATILAAGESDKPLLLAAIEAAANIRPQEAGEFLLALTESNDEDIAEAAYEAMAMVDMPWDQDTIIS